MGSADSHDTQIDEYYPISSIDEISAVVADRNGAEMRTPTSIGARTALGRGRDRTRGYWAAAARSCSLQWCWEPSSAADSPL